MCKDQDGNKEKCLRTIKTCEYEEDRCLSEIFWSTTPYWTQGAEKQYYVSKRCATEAECIKTIRNTFKYHTRLILLKLAWAGPINRSDSSKLSQQA